MLRPVWWILPKEIATSDSADMRAARKRSPPRRLHSTSSLFLSLTLFASSANANESPERLLSETVAIEPGYGWSERNQSSTYQKCVAGTSKDDEYIATYTIARRLQSSETLYRDLSVSIAAKAKARLKLGSGGVSASYKRFDSTLSSTNRLNFAMSFVADQSPSRLLPGSPGGTGEQTFRLTDVHRNLLLNNPTAFRSSCGDAFIVAVKRRSIATAIYTSQVDSLETKQNIEKTMGVSASYGPVSVSAVAKSVANSLEKKEISSTSVDFTTAGFKLRSGEQTAYNAPSLISDVEGYFKSIQTEQLAPVPYAVNVLPYTSLPECAGSAHCKPENQKEKLDPAAIYLERLAALQMERSIAKIGSNPLETDATREYLLQTHLKLTGDFGIQRSKGLDRAYIAHAEKMRLSLTRSEKCTRNPCLNDSTYDDFWWSLAIPVARNAVPAPVLASLLEGIKSSATLDTVRAEYAVLLWYNRIVQPAAVRCAESSECLQPDDRTYLCEALEMTSTKDIGDLCEKKSQGQPIKALIEGLNSKNPGIAQLLSDLGYPIP